MGSSPHPDLTEATLSPLTPRHECNTFINKKGCHPQLTFFKKNKNLNKTVEKQPL